MAKPFDATLNSLIDNHVQEWGNFLAARFNIRPGPVVPLDTDLSANFQADRLFLLDRAPPEAIHLELESGSRTTIPHALLRYNVFASGVHQVPVLSVVILLRPSANPSNVTGTYVSAMSSGFQYNVFRYGVIRLWEEPMEQWLNAGPGLAPLALLTNEAVDHLEETLNQVHSRLQQAKLSPATIKDVLGSTYVLCGLRYEQAQIQRLFERFSMTLEDSTTYQWIHKQGHNQGLLEGRTEGFGLGLEQGMERGIDHGRVEEARRLLLTLGTRRHGVPSETQLATINSLTDLTVLEQLIDGVYTKPDWTTLLANVRA